MREARDLGDRLGSTWLAARSQAQLGALFILRDDLRQTRALLKEALDLSVAARSTDTVTLCLAAYARLAFAEGDPGRAALLAGAAEGLRQRAGMRVWLALRQGEAELVAPARQMLGAERFEREFSAGSGLSQREGQPPPGPGAAPRRPKPRPAHTAEAALPTSALRCARSPTRIATPHVSGMPRQE